MIHRHVSGILEGEKMIVESMNNTIDVLEAADVDNMMYIATDVDNMM
jgi:hypothetical protein